MGVCLYFVSLSWEGSVWFGVGFEALNVAGKKYSN